MNVDEALFRGPLPEGFSRHAIRIAPGGEIAIARRGLPDVLVVVKDGEVELECRAGTRTRFGRGSMIPIALLPVVRLRNVGTGPLVLVAVSRSPLPTSDEFLRDSGSYVDC